MNLTPVQQQAFDQINGHLTAGFLGAVDHDDVNAVAAKLKELSPEDANAVIARMRESGQLDTLASEGIDGTWFGNGGYSAEERRELFNALAGKLSGDNLAAVSNAFEKAGSGEEGFNLAGEFGAAVASHAPADAKVAFIKALSGETADGKGLTGITMGGSWERKVDGDAAAVATVLGSLRGSQAEAAFDHLVQYPDQLKAVMSTGIDQTNMFSENGVMTSFDTARFRGVIDAAASISDPDLKARVFDAGAQQLKVIRDTPSVSVGANSVDRDDSLNEVRDSLTRLIDSNTTGIVRELTFNRETLDGSSLAAYTQVMFDTGQADKLGEQLTRMQFGNDVKTNPQDPVARLNESVTVDGETRRPNASALGYYVGAVEAGAGADAKDTKATQDNVTAMLKSMNAIVGAFTGPGGAAITGAGGEWINKGVELAINSTSVSTANRLAMAALPTERPEGGASYDVEERNGPYFGDFNDRRTWVVDHAQP